MDKIPASVEKSVRNFLHAARRKYSISAAYLYGSQAKGTASLWSDIDVALISDDFSDDLFDERLVLMHIAARIDDRIEPYPFTKQSFNENDPIASDIQRHGLRVE